MREFKVSVFFHLISLCMVLICWSAVVATGNELAANIGASNTKDALGLRVTLEKVERLHGVDVAFVYELKGMRNLQQGVEVTLGAIKFTGKQPSFYRATHATRYCTPGRNQLRLIKHANLPRGFVVAGFSQQLLLRYPPKARRFVFKRVPVDTSPVRQVIDTTEVVLEKVYVDSFLFSGRVVDQPAASGKTSTMYFVPGNTGKRNLGVEVEIRRPSAQDSVHMVAYLTDTSGRRQENFGQIGVAVWQGGICRTRLVYPFARVVPAPKWVTFELAEVQPVGANLTAWLAFTGAPAVVHKGASGSGHSR